MPAAALVALGLIAAVFGLPTAAWAHDPIFVNDQTPVEASPLIEDGTISFATYGQISTPGARASFRLRLAAGQQFGAELLVPDRPPENTRVDNSHLRMTITTPDGKVTELVGAAVIEQFDEPFSKTSYLRMLRHDAPAVAGITTITVSSSLPTRFTVATGQTEKFGTTVSDYERQGLDVLATWYRTPPPEVPVTSTPPSSTAPGSSAPSAAAVAPVLAAPSAPAAVAEVAQSEPTSTRTVWAALAALAVVAGLGASVVVRRRRSSPS